MANEWWTRPKPRGTARLAPVKRAAPTFPGAAGDLQMTLGTILIIVLLLVLIGALPTWGHSRSWGYFPSGGLGLILLIVVILVLMGRI